jgi:hypothetical protein
VDIILTERELVAVGRQGFAKIRNSPTVWRLIEKGILALSSSKNVPYGVRAGPYVGSCVLEDGTQLIVQEKTEGAVRHLLDWCLAKDARTLGVSSRGQRNQHAAWILACRYVEAVGRYLCSGRVKEYLVPLEIRSKASGRVNLRATVRLRSRGRMGVVACHPAALSGDVLVNRIAHAALTVCGRLLDGAPSNTPLRSILHSYCRLLHSSRLQGHALTSRDSIEKACNAALHRYAGNVTACEMLGLAKAILLDLGFFGDADGDDISESCFVSLEGLFERAVCGLLQETGCSVRGSSLGKPVFTDVPGAEPVDPDFVLVTEAGKPLVVGDCKFKDITKGPSTDDVYQLLTHSRACLCQTAALVYPGDAKTVRRVGRTVDGIEMFVCSVRLQSLEQDVRDLVNVFAVVQSI